MLESTTNIPFNARTSDSELPLTANFNKDPSYQQWDSSGRAVGYAPDPTLYAPQPRKPARVPGSGPSSSNASPAPYMSERDAYRGQPIRQNTGSSSASWDVQGQVGGPNAYQMTRQPYSDPFANPEPSRVAPPPQAPRLQQPYAQSPPAMRSVGNSPVTPTATGNFAEQTPTQARFAETGPPTGVPSPHSAPLPNPYAQPPPYSSPHSRSAGEEAYAAYDEPSIR